MRLKNLLSPLFVCAMFAFAPSALAQFTSADFSVSKTGPASSFQGTDVTFSITVTNNGPDPAQVTMDDTIANGWVFVSNTQPAGFTCTNPGSGATSGTVSCSNPLMAVGSAVIQVTLHIPDNAGSSHAFPNTATVSTTASDPNGANNSSTATTTTPPSTDITVVKTGPAQANADTDVAFTITVTNLGPDNATTAVNMNDNISGGWSFVSVTPAAGFACTDPGAGATSGTVSCSAPSMNAGATATFTIVFHIPPQTPDGTFFANTATVAAEFDFEPENDASTAVVGTPPPPQADLFIDKSGPTGAPPNSDVTYTITVTNPGPSDANNVSFTDTLPVGVPGGAQMTFVSFLQDSGPTFNCGSPGQTTTCTLASMPAGTAATFTVVGHIPSGTATGVTFTNAVTVSSSNDPGGENNTASTALTVSSASVSVVKSGPPTAVAGGPTYNYDITVANGGPDSATDVTFTDNLPVGLAFVSLTQNTGPAALCGNPLPGGGGTVSCTVPLLGNGQSATFTITVQAMGNVANGTVLSNTATVSTTSADTSSNDNSSTVMTTVSASADVGIVKTAPSGATAGTNLTYAITVTNNGPSSALNVSWSDTLPAGTTFVSFNQNTGPTFTCTTGAAVSCSIATLNSGATATFTLTVLISPAQNNSIGNTASVTTTSIDNNTGNDSSIAVTTINKLADLSVNKTGPATAAAGSNITYTITVRNNGPSDSGFTSTSDILPVGAVVFISDNQLTGPTFTCTPAAGMVGCTIASFPAGASATFAIVVQVKPTTPNGTVLTNSAFISSETVDPNDTNGATTFLTTVSANADLSVTKNGPIATSSNTTVAYTVTAANAGPATAANVVLTDAVPANMTFASASQLTGPPFNCSTPPSGGTGTITCTIASLAGGESASFQFVFNVPTGVAAGTQTTNTATVSSDTPDSDPSNNSASVTTTVGAPIPALSTLMLIALALALAAIAFRSAAA